MIRRSASYPAEQKEQMRGGEGVVVIEKLLSPDEIYEKGRLFAKMKLEPGASIGYHIHEGEMETFFILNGKAEYSDNGIIITLLPGDTTLTADGEGHSIKSVGDVPLELIAVILYK